MKELKSAAIALICLLTLLTPMDDGRPGPDDQHHTNRPARHSIDRDPQTQDAGRNELVLGPGDEAVIDESGQTVTITRVPAETLSCAKWCQGTPVHPATSD
jgi:hypothetical protein